MTVERSKKALRHFAKKNKADVLNKFFKTGPGEYGEGDIFIGVKVPEIRQVARRFTHLTIPELKQLLSSPIHEERLLALIILILQYREGDEPTRQKIFNFYIRNTRSINNWDLVDLSAPKIVGSYLMDKKKDILFRFARSNDLWKKRIAIVSTFYFISEGIFSSTLEIADILFFDPHDLIQKAVGWMLREVGKKDIVTLEQYLKSRYKKMPRTMLRYAIERFPERKRKAYLTGKI
jgi:3-methyladenine DNA glycosylase AlkD